MKQGSAIRKLDARLRGGTAAMLLGLYCAPAFASSGVDIICDNSSDYPLEVPALELCIVVDVVDGNSGNSITIKAIEADSLRSRLQVTSPAEEILHRIFDESLLFDPAEESSVATPLASPLIELTAPQILEQHVETKEKVDTTSADAEPPAISTRFPGVSEGESLRYRRQMFRTDI